MVLNINFTSAVLLTILATLPGCSSYPQKNNFSTKQDISTGKFVLNGHPYKDCGLWGFQWDQYDMNSELENNNWMELANLTIKEGCADNLSYYFLGRAAEGMGYIESAKSYYNLSINYKNNWLSPGDYYGARMDYLCKHGNEEICSSAKDQLKVLNGDSVGNDQDNVNTPTKIIRSFNQKSKTIKSKGDQYLLNNNDSSYIDDLKVIKNLLDKGVINDNEFKTMKKNIIDKI